MIILDYDKKTPINNIGLYLLPSEAEELRNELNTLLQNPDAATHVHLVSRKGNQAGVACSIITPKKLRDPGKYTEIEKKYLAGQC